jgi:hypothetical protein
MADDVTLRLSATTANRTLGKIIATVVYGALFGILFHQSSVADNLQAQQLTLERYTADFAAYKAHLAGHSWPWWGDVLLIVVMLGLLIGAYEALALGIAWAVGKLRQEPHPAAGATGPSVGA